MNNNGNNQNNNLVNSNTNYVNNSVSQINGGNPSFNNTNLNNIPNGMQQNNFNNQIQNNNLNTNMANNGNYQQIIQMQKQAEKALTLSIINLVVGVPFAVNFGVIWLIFGAFAEKITAYLVFGICGLYLLFSLFILVKSICNFIKYNKIAKRGF